MVRYDSDTNLYKQVSMCAVFFNEHIICTYDLTNIFFSELKRIKALEKL